MAHVQTHQPNQRGFQMNDHKDQGRPAAKADPEGRQSGPAGSEKTASPSRGATFTQPEKKGFEIAGFPWQFVVVISVVGLTVLAFIIKIVIGF
jgi:hypothetical protein